MSEAWPDVAEPGNRDAILTAAAALAGSDGLDGPSAGTLAMVLGRRLESASVQMAASTEPPSQEDKEDAPADMTAVAPCSISNRHQRDQRRH